MSQTIEQIKEQYKDYAPVPIIDIAKNLGIKLYETDSLKDNESGLIKKEGNDYVIYVNSNHSPVRKRFTIAHELSHYLLHKEHIGSGHVTTSKQPLQRAEGQVLTDKEREREVEANKLAAKLLMPKEKFISVWKESNTLEEVANKFKVSISAVAVRADKLLNETFI